MLAINPSKLHPPRKRPRLVGRPRLLRRVEDGLWRPLTLIVAPAGSGKTTLAAQWIEDAERPVAWLSLDPEDRDPLRFLRYLLATLGRACPDAGIGFDGVAPPSQLQDLRPLLTQTLLVPLAGEDVSAVLVLDDYHLVDSRVVDDAVAWLIESLPPSMHVVITTRTEPALPLNRWRARDEITEIGRSHLSFDEAEAGAFFADAFGLELGDETIAALQTRTEGWAAGLQLLGLSLRQGTTPEELLRGVAEDRFVAEYLAEELLDKMNPAHREFLLRCSILDELTGPLCAAVVDDDAAGETLREIDGRGLFLVPLDHRRRAYRLHHLFQDLLRARLDVEHPGLAGDLHARAARRYEEQEAPRRAAAHARRVPGDDALAALVDRWGYRVLYLSDGATLKGWLSELPAEAADRYPGVAVSAGWMAVLPLRIPPRTEEALVAVRAGREALRRVEDPESDHHRTLRSQLTAIESLATRPLGDVPGCVGHAGEALSTLDSDDDAVAGASSVLALALGITHAMSGRWDLAEPDLDRAVRWGHFGGNHFVAVAAMGYAGSCLLSAGRLREAEGRCREALAYAEEHGCTLLGGTAYVHGSLGHALFERWELPEALDAFETGVLQARLMGDPYPLVRMLSGLALVRGASGELELAEEAGREALSIAEAMGIPLLTVWARTALGLLDLASVGADAATLPELAEYDAVRHRAALLAVRATLARDGADGAGRRIEELRAAAEDGGRRLHAVDWEVESAVALVLDGQLDAAAAALADTLRKVEGEGMIRAVRERARELAPLRELVPRRLRKMMGPAPQVEAPRTVPVSRPSPQVAPLLEPPTAREIEVLALVADGLSNPEIGRKLFVSTGTIKTHMHRVLGKLGVRNRIEAVSVARAHGLIA